MMLMTRATPPRASILSLRERLQRGSVLASGDETYNADLSRRGLESCGVMVNYLYEPDQLEINHERYLERGEVVLSRELAAKATENRPSYRSIRSSSKRFVGR